MSGKTITTESVESNARVFANYDVYDMLFVLVYLMVCYGLMSNVHQSFRAIYMIFSGLIALFLTAGGTFNKKRKNYESLYLFFFADHTVYRPFVRKEK